MKRTRMIIAAILVLSLVLGACGGGAAQSGGGQAAGAAGDTVHITVGHAGSEQTLMHLGWVKFKEEIEERSGGSMTVEIFPNGQLGGDPQLQEAVQNGDLICTGCNTAALTGFEPRLGVFATPFVFESNQMAYDVLESPFGDKMLSMLEEHGFKGLGYYESVNFRVLSSNKPVRTPDDLNGVKIRVMQDPLHIAIWKSLGANPTSISFTELYTALQQNTVDAQENPLELIVSQRFYEVQKYITLTNHIFAVGMSTMNLDFYNALTADQQEIVHGAMDAAIDHQREIAAAEYEEYIRVLEEAGIEIITLTPDELAQFQQKTEAAFPVIADEVGQDLLDELLEATRGAA